MTKLKHNGILQLTALIFAVLFANSAALAESVPPFVSVSSNSSIHFSSAVTLELQKPDDALQLECPADISTSTDINECTADISSSLNVNSISGTLASLTWEMTGATKGTSNRAGINQIERYVFNEGVTFIRYTARDNAGNVTECQFTVTVTDNEAPIISAPKNLTIKCDGRIPSAHTTLQAFLNAGGFASDNCNLLVSSFALISEVKDNRNCPYTLTRTYQISDEYGNVGSVKQHIFVLDEEGLISQMAISNSGATATISYTKSDVTCRNDNNGFVQLIINGTSGTLSYIWLSRNGDGIIQGEKDQTSLSDGDYNVKVFEDEVYLLELNINILVADFEFPIITCPADIKIECGQNVPAAFTNLSQFENAGGKASDNCQLNYASFRMLSETKSRQICPYILTRTYQISDVNGNIGKAEHLIFVNEGAEPDPQQPLTLKSGMAGTFTAVKDGDWNDPATWGSSSFPGSGDDVIIPGPYKVSVNVNSVCNNIEIKMGGELKYSGVYNLQVNGNWINNGTFTAGSGTVSFSNPGSTITGPTTFGILVINTGANVNSVITVNSDLTINDLQLINGLLRINGGTTIIAALNEPTANPTHNIIPRSAGLEVNIGGKLITQDFTINNKGLIRINSGTAEFGNSTGNSIETNTDGAFIVEGGTVEIAGRLHNSASGTVFGTSYTAGITISSGTITLSTKGNGLSNVGSLNVTAVGNFNFTGGTIVFQNPSSATTELDLGLISGGGAKTTVGGTFQFGNGSTTPPAVFNISSGIILNRITSVANADLVLEGNTLVNNLALNSSSNIDLNGKALQLTVTSAGNYLFPIGTTTYNTPVNINFSSVGSSGTVTVSSANSKGNIPSNLSSTKYLNRHWNISSSGLGSFNASVGFNYLNADLTGGATTGNLKIYHTDPSNNTSFPAFTTGTNTFTTTNLTTFGELGAAECGTITITGSLTMVSCYAGNNGAIDISVSSGAAPFAYSWTGPASFTNPAEDINGLIAGTYNIIVTDAAGCEGTNSFEITQPTALTSTGIQSSTVSCFGGNDGSATVTPSGGTPPYTIAPAQTGLTAGTHTFTITDAKNCITTVNVTINQPTAALTVSGIQSSAVSCFGGNDGSATVTPSGGTPPYTIVPAQTGLAAGTHTFTVTDAKNCITTVDVTITQPTILTATGVELSAVSCNGLSDGVVTVTPSGGTLPYTITPAQTGLTAGTHTFTVTDGNGCTTTVNLTVSTIPDVTLPVITGCPASFSANTSGVSCYEVISYTAPTITDNCALTTVTWQLSGATNESSPVSGINYLTGNRNIQVGNTTITYTATDASGNSSICSYTITVVDNKLPVITCPNVNPSYNTDAGQCTASLSFTATATDNCGVQSIKYYIASTEISFPYNFPKGITTVNAVATDNSGNTADCNFNVNVVDAENPQINCVSGSPFTRNADAGVCNYTIQGTEFDPVSFTDNCTGTTITNNFNNQSTLAGAVLPSGNTTIIWTATDAAGNKSNCTISIQIVDAQVPVVSNCPGNINVETIPGQLTCSMAATWTPPTFTDYCSGAVSPVASHSPGQQFPVGTTTVTYTATDASGNSATCSFTVTVNDKTLPTFTAPGPKTVYAKTDCTYDISVGITGDVTNEFDNCTTTGLQATILSETISSGSCIGNYTITRVWTLTDNNGNTAVPQNQIITVADNLPPILNLPGNITINCNESFLPANTGIATANDNCGGILTPNYSDVTSEGSCAGEAIISRTWTVADCSGNNSTGVQIISIVDNEAPVVTAPSKNITCVELIPLSYADLNAFLADGNTVTNNCGGSLTFAFVEETPNYPIGVSGYCPNYIVRTYRITDECGNETVFNQTLNISNSVPPCKICSSCAYNNSLHEIDLRGNPEGFETVTTRKADKCCIEKKPNGTDKDPGWCASFNVLLDPDAVGVTIQIDGGPTPQGQEWKLNCNTIDGGGVICLPGGTYNLFTFCKDGNGEPQLSNNYTFTSVIGAVTGGEAYARVGDDCDVQLEVEGITSEPVWNSISPGTPGQYNHYLSATNITNPYFIPDEFAPATIQYQVCGIVGTVICDDTPAYDCDIVTVHAKDEIDIQLNIDPSDICGSIFPELIPNVLPSGSTYTFEWFSGYDGTGTSYGISNTFTPTTPGPYSVKVTDTQFNLYPCSFKVFPFDVGSDNIAPEITPPANLILECNQSGNADLITLWLASATATDRGLPITPVTNNYTGFTQTCEGTITVTFSATDICDNTSTATSQIIVDDTKAPVWLSASGSLDVTVECSNALALQNAQNMVPVYDDQCDEILNPVKTSGSFVPGIICPNEGTYTNTWVVTDACGNTSEVFSQVITVTDNTSPVWNTLTGALNQTVECGDVAGLAAAQALVPIASDNCDLNLTPVKTEVSFVSGPCGNTGIYTNSFTVTDDCGNLVAAPYIQTITIVDNTAASITCPLPVTVDALDGNCFATTVNLGTPTGTDLCGGTLTFTNNAPAQFPVGTTIVTWTATDACNNPVTCIQNVTVIDNEQPPTIICPDPIVLTALPGDCDLKAVVVPDPVTHDNCAVVLQTWNMSGATTGSSPNTGINVINGQNFEVGVTTVTYRVEDAAGNSATCSFTVTIHDQRIPEFTTCPDPITVTLPVGNCEMYINVPPPVVWDPCDEIVSVTHNSKYGTSPSDASGTYPAGVHTITWTITDESGNKNTCVQIITVIDTQVLAIDCSGLDVTKLADTGELFATGVTVGQPTVTPNCHDPELTWVMDPPINTSVDPDYDYVNDYTPEQLSGEGIFVGTGKYYVGVSTVYYTYTDTLGNKVECSFTITIEAKPDISCPPNRTVFTEPNQCDSTFNPGIPILLSGGQPINWTWTITNPDLTTSTGSSVTPQPVDGSLTPSAVNPNPYDFQVGTTTITWTATNDAGSATCSHTITVTDKQKPTFDVKPPFEECVDMIQSATYTTGTPQPFNRENLIIFSNPDGYTFIKGNDKLDIQNVDDNCCIQSISWEITFADTPNPADGTPMNNGTISGTGQPSTHADMFFPGDGVTFQPVVHTIEYIVEDCHGNSTTQSQTITINPRPEIIKMP